MIQRPTDDALAAFRLLAARVGLTACFIAKVEAAENPEIVAFWIQDLRARLDLAPIPTVRDGCR